MQSLLLAAFEQNEALREENRRFHVRVETLQEQLNLALARRYAASSEKIPADQLRLFDEAEVDAGAADDAPADDANTVEVAGYVRNKRGRRPLPDTLPRLEVVHELPESERVCPHDGALLQPIGDKVSEQLDIVPATIRVIRHIRKQYACECGQCVKTAARPVLDKLRRRVHTHLPQVAPRTATGKALGYVDEQWERLTRYLDDGRLEIDNNLTENAIRPFVVGRKN